MLEGEDRHFTTSYGKLWYPEHDSITFKPDQFHFHMGHGQKRHDSSDNGSEHTFDGEHKDMEMHIVSLNEDKDTFLAAVVAVLFEIDENAQELSFADRFFQDLLKPNKSGDKEGELLDFQKDFVDHLDFN